MKLQISALIRINPNNDWQAEVKEQQSVDGCGFNLSR